QLAREPGKAVRLSVKKSGCTGFMYVIDLVEKGVEGDLHYQLDDQVELLVDSGSLHVLSGTEIDLVTEGINRQIRFINRSEEHTSELQSRENLVCRLLLEKKNNKS